MYLDILQYLSNFYTFATVTYFTSIRLLNWNYFNQILINIILYFKTQELSFLTTLEGSTLTVLLCFISLSARTTLVLYFCSHFQFSTGLVMF